MHSSYSTISSSRQEHLKSAELDKLIKSKYGRTFRPFNNVILKDVWAKLEKKLAGDVLGIARKFFDNAIAGRPWTNLFEMHRRDSTGGEIMQSTTRKADLGYILN